MSQLKVVDLNEICILCCIPISYFWVKVVQFELRAEYQLCWIEMYQNKAYAAAFSVYPQDHA
jgi:hypothetical protein